MPDREPVNLDPVVVTGTRLKSDGFTGGDYTAVMNMFMESASKNDTPPSPESQPEPPPSDEISEDARAFLLSQQSFKNLPKAVQQLILNSYVAASFAVQFFARGGSIVAGDLTAASPASYQDGNPPVITIDSDLIDFALAAEQQGNTGNAEFYAKNIAGLLAHELGHMATDHIDWDMTGNASEYVEYRARLESLAIMFGVEIALNMGAEIPSGYVNNLVAKGIYEQYISDGDWDAALNALDAQVKGTTWGNGVDLNGDGKIDQVDKFMSQYPGGA